MLEKVKYTYKKWELATEIEDLLQMHIGIMPLINSEVELGKCAFKAIQYMSLGIPPVVSPVGANKKVVIDGENGYWANDEKEWYDCLEKLITNHQLRTGMGTNARNRIISNYSVKANKDKFLKLFN
jgi:glycosyltransferase involved in cell wall biosynthesis